MSDVVPVVALVAGRAAGEVLALAEPLSFWGGFEVETGRIIDRWHPNHGACLSGRVLVIRSGRGSSSGSSVLAEAIRCGTGPAAIVLRSRDAILTTGALVAGMLYGRTCPVVVAESDEEFARAVAARHAEVMADGETGQPRLVLD